jgi:hypothetical protein
MPDDVASSASTGDIGCIVTTAVIDNQHLDNIDTRNLPRQRRESSGQMIRLVKARYLDDELGHAPPGKLVPNSYQL